MKTKPGVTIQVTLSEKVLGWRLISLADLRAYLEIQGITKYRLVCK